MQILRNGTIVKDRRLDRLPSFDEKSRNYPVRKLVAGLIPKSQMWGCTKVLDQGPDGACVGFGCTHELIAEPVPVLNLDNKFAKEKVYWEAQKKDPWPGGSYPNAEPWYEGSDVKAGLGVIKDYGYCDEFRWSFTHLDTQLGIGYEGPGIAGTSWMTGMMDVDSNGFIHATGEDQGGHCYVYLGVNVEEKYFTILNSWGPWGIDGTGRAKLSFDDYEKLRKNQGEMAFLIGRHIIPNPQPLDPPKPDQPCLFSKGIASFHNLMYHITGRRTRLKVYRKD